MTPSLVWAFMARIGLTLYLALASALGPSLCCCLPGAVVELFASGNHPSAGHGCCGHHAASSREHPVKSGQTPQTPSPARQKDCPCKDGQSQPVVLTASHELESARSVAPLPRVLLAVLPLSPLPSCCLSEQVTERFPFHDARDLLSTFQTLRC